MTEEEARRWLQIQFDVSRETWGQLERYVSILLEEMTRQNLIAESTRPNVWSRHIVDSAQLVLLAAGAEQGPWVDLGSGAGLPGIVASILSKRDVTMIESRRKRVDFLNYVIGELGLEDASVFAGRVESSPTRRAAVISARAYAPLPKLFASAMHLSGPNSLWILPKGKNAHNELEVARASWQGVFHVERSVTDPESAIIIARAVQATGRKSRG